MFTFQTQNVTCIRVLTDDHKELTQAQSHLHTRSGRDDCHNGTQSSHLEFTVCVCLICFDLVSLTFRFQLVFRVSVTQFALVLTTA